MHRLSFKEFYSLASRVAEAELAQRGGDNGRGDTLLGEAQALIEAHGLAEHVGIKKIPYHEGTVCRLRRPDGYGGSYTIGPDGITFP